MMKFLFRIYADIAEDNSEPSLIAKVGLLAIFAYPLYLLSINFSIYKNVAFIKYTSLGFFVSLIGMSVL